jgi:hypothetical protein
MARVNTAPSVAASSRYASESPTSDQENRDPGTGRRDKGKGRASDMPSRGSLPTPTSVDDDATGSPNEDDADEDEEKFTRYFDPNQNAEERRILKRKSRALERDFNGKWTWHSLPGMP